MAKDASFQPQPDVDDMMAHMGIPQDAQPPQEAMAIAVVEPEPEEEESALPGSLLRLNEQRLSWLVQRACTRIEECRNDMGTQHGVAYATAGSWLWDRQTARLQYAGNFDWRKATGGIFVENNWSMNTPKRFIRLIAAKIANDLLGTQPFFAAMPENNEDPKLSKQVEAKVQDAVRLSNLQEVLTEAIRVAITEGERVVKLTHVKDETAFIGPATVAIDPRTGQPIRTPKGQYIFQKDDFIQDPQTGESRLKKELTFVAPPGPLQFARIERLTQTITHREGLDAGGITSEDFLWPIKVARLEDADILVHVYDEPLESLKANYGYLPEVQRLTPSGTQSHAGQPNKEMGEFENQSSVVETVNVHECYIRCDADEDGKDEWIFLVLDYNSRRAIYAEYLGNMKMKQPPFKLVRGIESVAGRAYALGIYKMFEQKNLFIDVQFNRVALKSSKEGSVTCVHRDFSEETRAGLDFVVGGKQVYHSPANSPYSKDRPGVYRINLNEVDEFAMDLLETVIQTGQLEFGVVSAADGEASDLNASGTATGIRNIERTGNILQRATENMIAADIEGILAMATDLILENMDEDEMQYTPGAEPLASLNRNEIRGMERDVRLLLTKARSEESLATNAAVVTLIEKYYAYPKWMQKEVRPFYVDQLKTLEVQDSDQRLREPTDEEIQAESQAQSAKDQKPATESITAKFGELPPELQQAFAKKAFDMDFPIGVFQAHAAAQQAALNPPPNEPIRADQGQLPAGIGNQPIPGADAA